MPEAYPLHLRTIQRASKSRSQPAAFRMAEPRRGYGYAQAVGTDTPVFWDVQFRFTTAEAAAFQLWFTQRINRGLDEFTLPIRTEFGLVTHTCRFLPDSLLDASEDGQTWVYTAQIMARAQSVPSAYSDAGGLIYSLPDWPVWAGLLDETVTQEIPEWNLNMLFTRSEILDPLITFTRSSGATRVNSSGLIETVVINAPRFDYDPVTLQPKGLLIEEQRTNELLNSDTMATQSIKVTAAQRTLSFYGAGTVTLSGAYSGTLVGSGVYPARSTLTFTPTAGTLTLTVTGSARFSQMELGAFPTSYIPTTSAATTRAADVAVMTGENFSGWYNQSAGSFLLDYNTLGPRANAGFTMAVVDSALPSSNYIGMAYNGTNTNAGSTYWRTGGEGVTTTHVSYAYGVYRRYGVSFDNTRALTVAVDGVINATATSTTDLPTVNSLNIGRLDGVSFTSSLWLRRIAYYPRRLSSAELQAITA